MRIVKRYAATHYTLYFPVDITIIHVNVLWLGELILPVKKKTFQIDFSEKISFVKYKRALIKGIKIGKHSVIPRNRFVIWT